MEPSRGSQRLSEIIAKSSQEQVAQAVGVSQQTVSDWKRGQMKPRGKNMVALNATYGIEPPEWFEKPIDAPSTPRTSRAKKPPAKSSRRKPARSRSAKAPGPKKAWAQADQAEVEQPRGETRAA